jgi:predicted lactoylglutathione lyase
MTKELWLNLPVKDVNRSRDFFTKIGFSFAPGPGNTSTSAPLQIGSKGVIVMLFEENLFKRFSGNELADTSKVSEVLISFDAESPAEVDEIAQKVTAAGGVIYAQPGESEGWMYACGFCDPDGHRWNPLFMDMSKMNG